MSVENKLSVQIVEKLFSEGVRELVSCPGGRSAALLNAFVDHGGFEIESIYDERTAGFYALGKSINSRRPVVVLTTSGSAVAGLYPAVLEGKYQVGAQLILLTADRPGAYRFTGAPQTINQLDFFGANGVTTVDVQSVQDVVLEEDVVHLNVSLEDPNPSMEIKTVYELGDLLVLGSLRQTEKSQVVKSLSLFHGHIVAEPLSNIKAEDFPNATVIKYADLLFSKIALKSFARVFRLGGVPVSKFWRSVDPKKTFFWNLYPYPGAPGVKGLSLDEIRDNLEMIPPQNEDFNDKIEIFESMVEEVVNELPASEVAQLKKISDLIPMGSRVFLGNSLPVREWIHCNPDRFENIGQRGVNGIDGSLAYFLGQLSSERENWIVLGDITCLYNINDFQILTKLKAQKVRVVVVNNSGGQIFSRIFKENQSYFVNAQTRSFKKLAEFWDIGYVEDFANSILPLKSLIELKPKNSASDHLWSEWKAIEF